MSKYNILVILNKKKPLKIPLLNISFKAPTVVSCMKNLYFKAEYPYLKANNRSVPEKTVILNQLSQNISNPVGSSLNL